MNETFSVHRELVLTSYIHLIQESNLTKFIRQTNVGPRCFTINIQLSLKWEKFYSTIRKKIRVVCILAILLSFSHAEYVLSFLTDEENKTSTSLESKDTEWNDLSILRQMINQVIRLLLVKNVNALVNDYNLMKQSLAGSETRVTGQQQTIDALKIQVDSLQQENNELKNSSRISETRIIELETK